MKFSRFKNQETPQCEICGKILLAEALAAKQHIDDEMLNPRSTKKTKSSRELGKSLNKLGDDDLFGELEPFDLEDGDPSAAGENAEQGLDILEGSADSNNKKSKKKTIKDKKFKNPMESSALLKKLKEDEDLFGSLNE